MALRVGSARAQDREAAAQALFDDAKKLFGANKFAEACPKFLASHKLDPQPGTVLNLADCYERNGQLASAWARYGETATLSSRAGQKEREAYARGRASELAPKLAHVTIVVNGAAPGETLKQDGVDVPREMIGVAVPIDLGSHPLEASAPNAKPWRGVIEVKADGASVRIEVPRLEPLAEDRPVVPDKPETPSETSDRGRSMRIGGLAAAGVGVAALGVGTVLALTAKSAYDDAVRDCSGDPPMCDHDAATAADAARSRGTIASVFFVIGGVGLAGGAALFFLAPKAESPAQRTALRVGFGASGTPFGLSLRRAF